MEPGKAAKTASMDGVDEIFWKMKRSLTVVSGLELGGPIWVGSDRNGMLWTGFSAKSWPCAGDEGYVAAIMPAVVVLGITEFVTGTNWGMYVIALPIVILLAQTIGADPLLCVAAVLSGGVWGAHICFDSDATILSSSASGCDNFQYAVTQMPYGFIGAGLAALAFLAVGFWT